MATTAKTLKHLPTVFSPGVDVGKESNEFINVVHILAIHGWSVGDSAAVETSTQFSDNARQTIRKMLDERGMQGTTLKTTPLSGCGPLPGEIENRQTIGDRVLGCLEELKASGTIEELRKADVVFVVSHSQGSVVAMVLVGTLIDAGALQPNIPGVQKVSILSMAGVFHGTHDKIAGNFLPSFWREASMELKLLRDPSSEIFTTYFLPAVVDILKKGVLIIAVSSYNDRVVNICSSLMDGVDHKNIIRGLFVHPRYTTNATDAWNQNMIHQHDILLCLWILAVQLRNEGLFIDFARFCTNIQIADQATATLSEAGKVAVQSFLEMPSTSGETMLTSTLAAATSFAFTFGKKISENKELMDNTKRMARDSDAHSVIHQDEDVYRFGFSTLLSRFTYFEDNSKERNGGFELPSPTLRPSFNLEPETEEDWRVLHQSIDAINAKGSETLKKRLATIEKILRDNPNVGLDEAGPLLRKELLSRINK